MNPAILSLFISSTNLDLAEEREAVSQMLRGLRESGFLGREHFGGRETPGRRTSLEEIEKSQLYILLLGGILGSGVIEDEYRRARDRHLPCLIYFKDEEVRDTDPERAGRLTALKNELALQHPMTLFSSPEELALRIRNDLFRWYFDHHLTYHCANDAIASINLAVEEKYAYRLEIGSEHGAIVYSRQTAPESPRATVPAAPEMGPGELPGRETETALAKTAIGQRIPVVVFGPAGMGKSALLHWLAGASQSLFPDGVVRIVRAGAKCADDLFQLIFDALFESDAPRKCAAAECEQLLGDKRALILLDEVEAADDEIQRVMKTLPGCAFAIGSEQQRLTGVARQIELRGLAIEEAIELFSREMGRPLESDETAIVQQFSEKLECNPRRVLMAAAMARETPDALAEMDATRELPELIRWMNSHALLSITEHEERAILLLGAANGTSLTAETISARTGIPAVAPFLESLCSRRLIETCGNRYRVCEPLGEFLPQILDLTDWHRQLFDHFSEWLEAHRENPRQVQEEWEVVFALPDWTRAAGRAPEIIRLGRALDPSLALSGQWELWKEALQKVLMAAQVAEDRATEAWALHQLGTRALCLGEKETARRLLSEALEIRDSLGNHSAASITRHNLDFLLPHNRGEQNPLLAADAPPFAGAASFEEKVIWDRRTQIIPFVRSETKPLPETRRLAWLPPPSRRLALIGVAALLLLIGGMTIARLKSRRVPQAQAAVSPAPDSVVIATPRINADPATPSPSPGASPSPAANTPQLIVSTDLLTFEPVEQGKAARAQLALKNEGAVPLTISEVKLIGANAGEFKLANNCSRRIAAKQDCVINVEYSPRSLQQAGGHEASLLIASNAGGSPRYVALKGDVVAPAPRIEAAPNKIDFGLSVNRTASNQEIISFRNAGSGSLTISSLSIAETDAFIFNDINCRGRALDPGESCSVSLGFRPKNDGDYNASLVIRSNARNNPLAVPLEGRRQLIVNRAPNLAVYPNLLRLNFTGQPNNDRKFTRGLIRLTNQGEVPLTVNDVGIDGPNAGSFQLSHKCKGAQLAPGDHCDIEAVFAPGQQISAAEHRARVVVAINEGATPQTILLNGSVSLQR
ncbi:MAG: choice-of-anchor D domain-containing protein [Blastocatellia bacterium]